MKKLLLSLLAVTSLSTYADITVMCIHYGIAEEYDLEINIYEDTGKARVGIMKSKNFGENPLGPDNLDVQEEFYVERYFDSYKVEKDQDGSVKKITLGDIKLESNQSHKKIKDVQIDFKTWSWGPKVSVKGSFLSTPWSMKFRLCDR